MASEKQIAANRQNAQHSTGPVTPEGKAAAAQNAFKHGLRARKVLFDSDERLQQFRDELEAQYQPRNFTEAALVEQMALALFKRTRFEELEGCCESLINQFRFGDPLETIWRRQAALDRAFHKAAGQLAKLRKSPRTETAGTVAKAAEAEPVTVAAKSDTASKSDPASKSEPAPGPTSQPSVSSRIIFVGKSPRRESDSPSN